MCVSVGKKRSFLGKFGVLCILVTSILRFTFLPYYRQYIVISLSVSYDYVSYKQNMFFKRLQFFLFISLFVLKSCLQLIVKLSVWNILVKSNAGCNEFESNKVDCRMCLVQKKIRQGSWKKQNEEKKW